MNDHILHDIFHFKVPCYSIPDQMLVLKETISTRDNLIISFRKSTVVSPRSKTFHVVKINTMFFELSLNVLSNFHFSIGVIVPPREKLSLFEAFDF
jgi:hypothetical protein